MEREQRRSRSEPPSGQPTACVRVYRNAAHLLCRLPPKVGLTMLGGHSAGTELYIVPSAGRGTRTVQGVRI